MSLCLTQWVRAHLSTYLERLQKRRNLRSPHHRDISVSRQATGGCVGHRLLGAPNISYHWRRSTRLPIPEQAQATSDIYPSRVSRRCAVSRSTHIDIRDEDKTRRIARSAVSHRRPKATVSNYVTYICVTIKTIITYYAKTSPV